MSKLVYKFKNNKLFFAVAIALLLVVVYDVFVLTFDIIQFAKLSESAVNRFSGFETINILAGVLNAAMIVLIVFYMIFSRRKISVKISGK